MFRARRGSIARLLLGHGRRLGDELADLVFPETCPLCGAPGPSTGCAEHALPTGQGAPRGHGGAPREPRVAEAAEPAPRCGICAVRLSPFLPDGTRCAACRRARPAFERLLFLGDYAEDAGLRAWILALKHGRRPGLAGPLGRALARRISGPGEGATRPAPRLFVPVPLHPLRRLERGHDQARLLAEEVARALGGRCVRRLRRVRSTPRQGHPGARSRLANVRGAFATRRGARLFPGGSGGSGGPGERDEPVWLVDDVATSGATLSACARVLRRDGARRVLALVLARATPRADPVDGGPGRAVAGGDGAWDAPRP